MTSYLLKVTGVIIFPTVVKPEVLVSSGRFSFGQLQESRPLVLQQKFSRYRFFFAEVIMLAVWFSAFFSFLIKCLLFQEVDDFA